MPKLVALRRQGDALLRQYAQRITAAYQGVMSRILGRSRLLLGQIKHASPQRHRIGAG